jgi:hypothetical protein
MIRGGTELVEKFLDKLEDKGIEFTTLRKNMYWPDVDMEAGLADLKLLWKEFKEK